MLSIVRKNKLIYHEDVKEDIKNIPKENLIELRQHINKLKNNPFLGQPLEDKNGKDLRGYYKIYFGEAKYRLIYKPTKNEIEILSISDASEQYTSIIIAIGKRENEEIYDKAFKRK